MITKARARERITVSSSAVGLTFASGYGTVTQGTGTVTGSPVTLASGANTIVFSGAGTATVKVYAGCAASAADGTATLTASPTVCLEGASTAIDTGATTGNVVVTVTAANKYNAVNMLYARIQCLTANVRFCVNGSTPVATTTGELLYVGEVIEVWGQGDMLSFSAIRDTSSNGALDVEYFGSN